MRALLLVAVLLGSHGFAAAQEIELGAVAETYEFPTSTTTLFRWDASHAAVLDPQKRLVTILGSGKQIQLDRSFSGHSGAIYPDPVDRYAGEIYWATQAKTLGVFGDDGRLHYSHTLRGSPLSIDVRNQKARVVVTTADGVWETVLSPSGETSYEEGWLPGNDTLADRGTWFREVIGERVIEIAAFYPIIRIDSVAFSIDPRCSEVIRTPVPVKTVAPTSDPQPPWALAADHAPTSQFVMVALNGGALLTIDGVRGTYSCKQIPRPNEERFVHTGIVMVGDRLWVLTRTAKSVLLRSWPLRAKASR